jgi:hypothetical protein
MGRGRLDSRPGCDDACDQELIVFKLEFDERLHRSGKEHRCFEQGRLRFPGDWCLKPHATIEPQLSERDTLLFGR